MEKLPAFTFSFIFMRDLTKSQIDDFNVWITSYNGECPRWDRNHELLIPYEVYDCWLRYNEDKLLIEKMKEVMNK